MHVPSVTHVDCVRCIYSFFRNIFTDELTCSHLLCADYAKMLKKRDKHPSGDTIEIDMDTLRASTRAAAEREQRKAEREREREQLVRKAGGGGASAGADVKGGGSGSGGGAGVNAAAAGSYTTHAFSVEPPPSGSDAGGLDVAMSAGWGAPPPPERYHLGEQPHQHAQQSYARGAAHVRTMSGA